MMDNRYYPLMAERLSEDQVFLLGFFLELSPESNWKFNLEGHRPIMLEWLGSYQNKPSHLHIKTELIDEIVGVNGIEVLKGVIKTERDKRIYERAGRITEQDASS